MQTYFPSVAGSRNNTLRSVNNPLLEEPRRNVPRGTSYNFPQPATTPQANFRPGPQNPFYTPPDYLSSGSGFGTGDGDIPKLDLAPYDLDRVEQITQRTAAPGIRRLRSEMQNVQQGVYDNPNVKAMTMRQALSGYGQGLESIMGGAYKEGRAAYGEERGIEDTEAKSNWEAKLRASLMRYQRELYPPRSGRGSGFSAY
jgi:hypothetical protein